MQWLIQRPTTGYHAENKTTVELPAPSGPCKCHLGLPRLRSKAEEQAKILWNLERTSAAKPCLPAVTDHCTRGLTAAMTSCTRPTTPQTNWNTRVHREGAREGPPLAEELLTTGGYCGRKKLFFSRIETPDAYGHTRATAHGRTPMHA